MSPVLTGSVELFGRRRRALQSRGVEVAPFVLGFVRTGAAGRRRGRSGRNRAVRRSDALAFIEPEQPRHDRCEDGHRVLNSLPLHACHAADLRVRTAPRTPLRADDWLTRSSFRRSERKPRPLCVYGGRKASEIILPESYISFYVKSFYRYCECLLKYF